MAKSYSISELSDELGCTPRALRFYEEKGLLSPLRQRDDHYAPRMYSPDEAERARMICKLRAAEIALDDIKDALAAPPKNRRKIATALLSGKLKQLEGVRAAAKQALQDFGAKP